VKAFSTTSPGLADVLKEYNVICGGEGADDMLLLPSDAGTGCNRPPLATAESEHTGVVGVGGDCCAACEDELEPAESIELVRRISHRLYGPFLAPGT
jgi:hypothetical protein